MCLGPRCKAIDVGSFIPEAEARAELGLQCRENTTGECSGEQNPADLLMTARTENPERSPLNRANIPKDRPNSCSERHCELMTGGVMRKPKDPFDFHVYIGFSPDNDAIIQPVIHKLKTALNTLCHFRGNKNIADKKNKEAIKYSIMCSEKCLLFITPEYKKDPWFEAEVNAAVEKARRFGKDMLFVVKDSEVPAESLADLHGFQTAEIDDMLPNQLISWLRQDAGLAPITELPGEIGLSGYSAAFAYYYSYLIMVLDNHCQDMMSLGVARSGAKVVLPMLIVVPEISDRMPTSFDVEGNTCLQYIVTVSHREGNKNRDFKRPVRKLVVDAEKNDVIYFSADLPAILLTLYETSKTGGTDLTNSQLEEIRTDFHRTLQSLLCHPDNQHCVDQYRLVLWPDSRVDLYDFLLPIVRTAAEEREASSLVYAPQRRGSDLMKSSFCRVKSQNTNLRKLFGASEPYVMRDVSPRGICLIINIYDVTPTSHTDVQQLHRLFSEQFDFHVRVHIDRMTWDQLDTLMCKAAQEDHSRYDAFVCYLASRGRLGIVCTSDEISNSVVTLVNNFIKNNFQTLHGKPKLFLIHTTDDGTTDNSVSDSRETLQVWPTLLYFKKSNLSSRSCARNCAKYCR